jgi:hypothetical protein
MELKKAEEDVSLEWEGKLTEVWGDFIPLRGKSP